MEENLSVNYYHSPIGIIEVKSDPGGVRTILYIDETEGLQVPDGEKKEADPEGIGSLCVAQLDEYFSGGRRVFDFPFSQTGTDFQQKVWAALVDIPYGKTISYLELSGRIGNKKAIRAVGTTNGRNRLNIVVPCHRVIGSNGSLVGYGGGLWRKKWLLAHEAKYGHGVQELGDW